MVSKQVRAIGKRRDVMDIKRMAEALLDFIEGLNNTERKRLTAAGGRAIKQRVKRQTKGTAA